MNCPKCGRENPAEGKSCQFCNAELQPVQTGRDPVTVRTSRLAVVSLVLGILSPLAFVAAIAVRNEAVLALWLVGMAAAVLIGVVGAIQIGLSGGRVVGVGIAVMGVAIPVVLFLFVCMVLIPRTGGRAYRMICGTNLSLMAKAMLIYAVDYEGKFPRAGGKDSAWAARIGNWQGEDRIRAFNMEPNGSGGKASISSSLYLLVKYGEVKPGTFICKKGEPKATEFNPRQYGAGDRRLSDFWDFGPEPPKHCSYAYHIPYGRFPLTTNDNPRLPVAADRNPWIDSPFAKAKDFSRFKPDMGRGNGTVQDARWGNTRLHQDDGQNVLFLDSHVSFEKRSYCGVKDDNIYTYWGEGDTSRGVPPQLGSEPASKEDSLLVNDPPSEMKEAKRRWWLW